MEYFVDRSALNSKGEINISEKEYQSIKEAKNFLSEALSIEKKFDILMENYYEFEIDLLNISTRHMIFRGELNEEKFHNDLTLMNRRLANLLSSTKLYIDHGKHQLSSCFHLDKETINQNYSFEYDNTLDYRVMEALRNYIQHRDLPIDGRTYNSQENYDNTQWLYSQTLYFKIANLKNDGKFKKTILTELSNIGEKHYIKNYVRGYIESLYRIHNKIRLQIEKYIYDSNDVFNLYSTKYQEETNFKEKTIGLRAIKYDNKILDEIYILNDYVYNIERLKKKNTSLKNLSSQYVTSEIII